ncbi:MAG: hypothetical protein KatS3mg019_0190 [Fimbriimonadales bacterium]|nr:MAG: hypothetical protein KatS3mg019_0190 [Fimbriimonadales bacterium]
MFEKSVASGIKHPMKRRYPNHATLTTVHTIYALVQRFCQQHPRPPQRGRPHQYPEPLILTLLLIAVREHASYRRLRFALTTGLFVLWNMVGLVRVLGGDGSGGFVVCCVWVMGVLGDFSNTLYTP